MTTIIDYKNNMYRIIDVCDPHTHTTLMECEKTGDRVRIRAYGWADIGFVKP